MAPGGTAVNRRSRGISSRFCHDDHTLRTLFTLPQQRYLGWLPRVGRSHEQKWRKPITASWSSSLSIRRSSNPRRPTEPGLKRCRRAGDPGARLSLEQQPRAAQLGQQLRIGRQPFHRDPAVPVRGDAPALIADMGLGKPVVEDGAGGNLLTRQQPSDPLGIQVEQQRQQIQRTVARRVGRQIIVGEAGEIGAVVLAPAPDGCNLRENPAVPPRARCAWRSWWRAARGPAA